ncbi:hypothetical protein [Spirillospora albida]|uniref:hypothetical protein n=1 Tax=Spirillospora albida TaxID=58123 RepID=UPI0012F99A9A|nr:hypothetical protein [Spirillospora albida]
MSKAGKSYPIEAAITLTFANREPHLRLVDFDNRLPLALHIDRIDVPPGQPLTPCQATVEMERARSPHNNNRRHLSGEIVAGQVSATKRVIVHVSGAQLRAQLPMVGTEHGEQGQIAFTLPGWTLRLAVDAQPYAFVIDAIPDCLPVTAEALETLQQRLFLILSFLRGTEIGLVATAGVDGSGTVIWAKWARPRQGTGQWRWCPDHLFAEALTDLAQAFSRLANNPTMDKVVDRAINLYLTANGTQPIDARIPVACSGLELLAWAVLQTEQWLTTAAFGKLYAAANLRLLLQWAGIPIDVPSPFSELEARRRGLGQPDAAAPEAVINIRNDLVHPPKKLSNLEWPSPTEMQQAWRLSMHYTELVILRLLDYRGHYLPRLQLTDRFAMDTEPVPWAK